MGRMLPLEGFHRGISSKKLANQYNAKFRIKYGKYLGFP